MEMLFGILLDDGPAFVIGGAFIYALGRLRGFLHHHPEAVPDEFDDVLKIATGHEHDYRIAGRRGNEIQKNCVAMVDGRMCGRTIYVSRDQPQGVRL